MAKARKLQQEVDATLKRVQEGCDEWDALWDKLEDTADASQRDKIICELKRDLKKLQRLRETVRGWAAGGDVKDHTPLQDARRNVEREMERFKLLEKEIKTKAFSSEGLKRDMNDPLTAAKYSCGEWLNETVSRLTVQIEEMEADVERLLPDCKGKGRTKNSRVSELEAWIGRHKDHVMRLEQVLRLMENDQVAPDDVMSALKDGLEYYLDSYSDPDFMEDESLYDSLPLDEVDETVGKITAHTPRASSKRQKPDAMQVGVQGVRLYPSLALHCTTVGSTELTLTRRATWSSHGCSSSAVAQSWLSSCTNSARSTATGLFWCVDPMPPRAAYLWSGPYPTCSLHLGKAPTGRSSSRPLSALEDALLNGAWRPGWLAMTLGMLGC